jgi:hypothetical protein
MKRERKERDKSGITPGGAEMERGKKKRPPTGGLIKF